MSAVLDRTRPPAAETLRPLTLPEFEEFVFDNGVRLFVAEDSQLPEVSLRLIVEAGAGADAPELSGGAELTGRLLSEGSGDRSAVEMAAWLDRLGAAFAASVGYDVATLSMHFLSDVTEGALDYLHAVVREPSLLEEEVERVRQERLDEIERHLDEPSVLADRALVRTLYGDHVYGRPSGGIRETVERLDVEVIRRFHADRYTAAGAVFVACGDVDAGLLRDRLAERFGDWSSGAGRPELPPPEDVNHAEGPVLVPKPRSAQAEVRIGRVGLPRHSPDFFRATLANALLGGLFNSRINMNLREDKGWTYGARSQFHFRRGAGPFVVSTAVESEAAPDAIREILSEITGLEARPPDEEELRLAKNALTLSMPRQFETPTQVTRKVATQRIYDLPADYWERYIDLVEAVTAEDIVEVAGRHLRPDEMTALVVAEEEDVRAFLEKLGPVRTETPA